MLKPFAEGRVANSRERVKIYHSSKEYNYFIPFNELNLIHIKHKYGFRSIKLVNEIIYITTRYGDEFYVEKSWRCDINDYISKLHHKNTKHNTDEYHEELKYFENIFMVFGYIRHHENKPFDNKRTPQIRKMERVKELFKQIS